MGPHRDSGEQAWPVLQAALVTDDDGRRVLAALVRDPDRGADELRSWLVSRGDRIITNVHGGHVEQLVNIAKVEALTITAPPPAPVVPRQLPAGIDDFVGRETIAAELERMLLGPADARRLVQISGPAGIGKTTLAVRVANRVADRFPDGQLYVDLRGGGLPRTAAVVLGEFLRALGVDDRLIPAEIGEREALLRTRTRERALLFVLDNALDEGQVRPLLPGSGASAVLITARRRLVSLEGVRIVAVPLLSPAESYRLAAYIVGDARADGERASIEELARLSGYLPLALRIAATRLAARPGRPIAWLVRRLGDKHRILEELHVGDRDIRASFALSYVDRSESQKRAFRVLSALDAPDLAAWTMAGLLGIAVPEAESDLEALVDNELVEDAGTDAAGHARYRLHDLLRAFGREAAADELPSVLDDACAWYAELCQRATEEVSPGGYHQAIPRAAGAVDRPADAIEAAFVGGPLTWFEAERLALLATLYQADIAGCRAVCWRLANSLPDFMELHGDMVQWQRVARIGVAAATADGQPEAEAYARRSLGIALLYSQDLTHAADALHAALNLFTAVGSGKQRAITLRSLGEALTVPDSVPAATGYFAEAQSIFDALDEPEWQAWTRWSAAIAQSVGDDDVAAIEHLRDCLAMFERLDHVRGIAVAVRSLAEIHRRRGETDLALAELERCLPLFHAVHDRLGEALAWRSLSDLYAAQGRPDDSERAQALAEPVLSEIVDTAVFR